MSSIRVDRLAFSYSDTVTLLADVDLHLAPGFTGIVGANGAGKSTLFALLEGRLHPSAGQITFDPRDGLLASVPQGIEALGPEIAGFADAGDAEAGRWRSMLGLEPAMLARWSSLSPGERRRWQIGAALTRRPDVLLLDEPTNHVDASTRARLVAALRRFTGIGLVISHDRALLDELATSTIRIANGTVEHAPGNYTAAAAQWAAAAERARAMRRDAQRTARHAADKLAEARVDQQRANANRKGSRRMRNADDHDAMSMGATTVVGWAEARHGRRVEVARRDAARALAAIPASAAERELGRSLFVAYEPAPRRWLFELDAPIVAAGEAAILRDVRLAVGARARIWITGDNGAGKSTLLGALLAQHRLPPDRVLYLPQELDDDAGPRLLERVAALPSEARGRTLSLVAALGVDPDRLLASCAPSPGEARKLALAFGLATHAWCLVLDEPTNHLDLPAIERLESALAAYPGALVLVSHDARFARACTTERWQLAAGRVEAAVRATAG